MPKTLTTISVIISQCSNERIIMALVQTHLGLGEGEAIAQAVRHRVFCKAVKIDENLVQ